MSEQSYYEVLGVSNDASDTDLKKAYRQLSLKYHPDRCSDPDAAHIMQQVNEAYETLSDPQKKQQYDNPNPFGPGGPGGMHGFPGGFQFNMGGFNMGDIFGQMFGGHPGGGFRPQMPS
mgnify:CR=1 FL=1